MRRRTLRFVVLAIVALLIAGLVLATTADPAEPAGLGVGPSEIMGGGRATHDATRHEQVQLRPPPDDPGCGRVIVIGDSLTDNAHWWLITGLRDAGFTAIVDAHHTRRIPASVNAPFSGVRAARSVRATWGDADCWVIALGSNDLVRGADDPAAVDALLDEMLGAVTPGADVWWVNVDYHRDPRTSFDFVGATAVFNAALEDRAAIDHDLHVIDWYTYAEANLHWFFDPVHVDRAGSIARAEQTVAALPR